MELQKGRPADYALRLEKEIRTYEFLDSLGIEYYRVDHAPAMTMEDCEAIDKVLLASTCKNLFLCNRQQTDFYLLLMPASKPFKTKELSAQLGVARLSFASAEYMERFLDITPGAVSVMGLINDKEKNVRLLIDKDLLEVEEFGCHPCVNTTSIKIKTKELFETVLPTLERNYTVVEL